MIIRCCLTLCSSFLTPTTQWRWGWKDLLFTIVWSWDEVLCCNGVRRSCMVTITPSLVVCCDAHHHPHSSSSSTSPTCGQNHHHHHYQHHHHHHQVYKNHHHHHHHQVTTTTIHRALPAVHLPIPPISELWPGIRLYRQIPSDGSQSKTICWTIRQPPG